MRKYYSVGLALALRIGTWIKLLWRALEIPEKPAKHIIVIVRCFHKVVRAMQTSRKYFVNNLGSVDYCTATLEASYFVNLL